MKKLFFAFLAMFFSVALSAQTLKVHNTSDCTIEFYVSATDAACATSASSINYSIAPGGLMYFDFSTTSWLGTTPGTGWKWNFIKEWNACGPYNWVSPDCSGGANVNVCAVGTPCSGIPLTSCMKINAMCNTCKGVKTEWTDFATGDVYVKIW